MNTADAEFDTECQRLRAEGLTYREIAARLGSNQTRAARACNRARARAVDRGRSRLKATDTSQAAICADCGAPCWRTKHNGGTGAKRKRYPADKGRAHRCRKCRGPWTPEKAAALNARRRANLHAAHVEDVDPLVVYERDRWRCHLCRKRVGKLIKYPHPRSASLDHVVPLSQGGEHSYANTRLAHLVCNLKKNCRGGGEQLALIG